MALPNDPLPFTLLARASDGLILTGSMDSSETLEFQQVSPKLFIIDRQRSFLKKRQKNFLKQIPQSHQIK